MITQLLFDKKLRYTKKGITIGAIAGMLWGLGGVVMAIALLCTAGRIGGGELTL